MRIVFYILFYTMLALLVTKCEDKQDEFELVLTRKMVRDTSIDLTWEQPNKEVESCMIVYSGGGAENIIEYFDCMPPVTISGLIPESLYVIKAKLFFTDGTVTKFSNEILIYTTKNGQGNQPPAPPID